MVYSASRNHDIKSACEGIQSFLMSVVPETPMLPKEIENNRSCSFLNVHHRESSKE